MARHSTHSVRSWIMDFTTQPLLAFRSGVFCRVSQIVQLSTALLCWGDPVSQNGARPKAGIVHSQRCENVLSRKFIERQTAGPMNDFAQSNVVDVAVNETRARLTAQRLFDQVSDRFVITGPTIP